MATIDLKAELAEIQAVGRMFSTRNLADIKRAIETLQELVLRYEAAVQTAEAYTIPWYDAMAAQGSAREMLREAGELAARAGVDMIRIKDDKIRLFRKLTDY